jgi:hypothetical protein
MKRSAFGGVLIVSAAAVLNAQTAPTVSVQTPIPMSSAQNITLSGCIIPGATAADPFTLSNAARLGPMTVPEPGSTLGATSGVGLVGSSGTIPTAGTAGGTMPTATGSVGTAGATNSGTVPPSTYQLSGASVRSYAGQSVFVTGMLLPTPNVAATAGAESSGVFRPTGGTDVIGAPVTPPTVPVFHVTRVESMGLRCP